MPPRSPKRTSRLQSSTAHKSDRRSESDGIDIPLNWLKSGIGVLLLPCCIVLLCGGKITEFKVKSAGGHIVTNKNNVIISLSPYFIPFYSVIILALFGIIAFFVEDLFNYHPGVLFWGQIGFSWSWLLYMSIGVTWCFHLTFTTWMITKNQPDLKQNGTFFSLVFIYFINLIILSGTLIIVSNEISLTGFIQSLLSNGNELINRISKIIG